MNKYWLVLGSCRVVNTIAYESGRDVILNTNDLWFTHYLHEHIQKINHLFGVRSIPNKYKELCVRFEQENHYIHHPHLRVGDSLHTGAVALQPHDDNGTLNVAVELPTARYIKIPTDLGTLWGHITNLELIRSAPVNQVGGHYTNEAFLENLINFEQVVIDQISSSGLAKAVNFIYVPHNPFIAIKDEGWKLSSGRMQGFNLIKQHCAASELHTNFPVQRCYLDVKAMIEQNGGVDFMLEDQNHYSTAGRKVAFNYLNELAII